MTTHKMTIRYESKEVRDAAVKTGMTDGMEMSYQKLDDLLAEQQALSAAPSGGARPRVAHSQQRAAGRRQRIGGLAVEPADGRLQQLELCEPLEHAREPRSRARRAPPRRR